MFSASMHVNGVIKLVINFYDDKLFQVVFVTLYAYLMYSLMLMHWCYKIDVMNRGVAHIHVHVYMH